MPVHQGRAPRDQGDDSGIVSIISSIDVLVSLPCISIIISMSII